MKQMKSDISETLKTLVSATKEEGQFPHTVPRWELSICLNQLLQASITHPSVIIFLTSVAPGLLAPKKQFIQGGPKLLQLIHLPSIKIVILSARGMTNDIS